MPAHDPKQRKLVAAIAAADRHHPGTSHDLRQELRASRIESYVSQLVAAAPPLTAEQRNRLALLMLGGEPHVA